MLLLLACSSSKKKDPGDLPAYLRYTGSLFRAGLTLSEEKGWEVLILSAKFGFVRKEALLPYYDNKFKKAYNGLWPDGEGAYLGGPLYFSNAPSSFKPLVPNGLPIGEMVKQTQLLLEDPGLRSAYGVTATHYKALRSGKYTKDDLKALLDREYPTGHPRMHATVDIQLRQGRIGDERGCWLRKEGDRYWLESKDA